MWRCDSGTAHKAAGAFPGEARGVGPSTCGDHDSAYAPMMPDGVDPATLYGTVDPADAPVIPDCVDPPILDGVDPSDAPVILDDVDPMIPGADASICNGDPVTPGADAPMIPGADALAIPGDAAPGGGRSLDALLGILITLFSSSETRNGSLSKWISIVAGEIHVRGRGVCSRCSLGVRAVKRFPRRLDWVSYWWSRNVVHPVRPQPK